MSPNSGKKTVRRLVLGRETLRTLAVPSDFRTANPDSECSCHEICSCNTVTG